MAMILDKKEDVNDELSKRISADLRAKANETSKVIGADPDLVDDSEYVKDFQKTGRFGFLWVVLVLGLIVLAVALIIK
ncbi:MAG: hypothetical protein Q4B65_01080 [Candidatus Saccharibacteria bacterium]|nr:hypothetical protein [Candidatus Saccharibacteria bacterium]